MIYLAFALQSAGVLVVSYLCYQWGRADQRKADAAALHDAFRHHIERADRVINDSKHR